MSEKISEIEKDNGQGVGLLGMIAIVFGSMVGGGIFNIAQNMASTAHLGAVIISWLITGFGMVFLVLTFKILSDQRPDLKQGIYRYAQVGFGNYIGFNIAWGYWLCVAFGNVSFAVMLNDAFGAFFPILLRHEWPTLLFCWGVIWGMFLLVLRGIMTASFINTVMTVLKFGAIIIIVTLLFVYLDSDLLWGDIWGDNAIEDYPPVAGLPSQIMGTMLITMFCFVGVEGAVMLSSYAKNRKDVGKASVTGFYLALVIYALISILCYGVRTRAELATMHDPSIAYVLKSVCGNWAYYFVICTVIVSIMSGFIAWTLLCAQTPYGAASIHILPEQFTRVNKHNVPYYGLCISSIFMSLFIILVCTAPDVYMASLNLTTITVLPCYAFSGAFLMKLAGQKKGFLYEVSPSKRLNYTIIGIMCTLYCIWCIFAGGPLIFLASSVLYALGFYFYYLTWRQNNRREGVESQLLSNSEKLLFLLILVCAVISIVFICLGKISLS